MYSISLRPHAQSPSACAEPLYVYRTTLLNVKG